MGLRTSLPRLAVDAPAFLAALKAHGGRVELAISPKAGSRGVLVHSWQALGNPDGVIAIGRSAGGREATIVRPDGSTEPLEWFPSFEIRVVRGTNAYPFKTTVEPFESSRPTGYVLDRLLTRPARAITARPASAIVLPRQHNG